MSLSGLQERLPMAGLEGALGLCRRAGKLVCGADAVHDSVKRGKTVLVLCASDAAENTFGRLNAICTHRNVPCVRIRLTKSELSHCTGLERETGAVGVPREFLNIVSASL